MPAWNLKCGLTGDLLPEMQHPATRAGLELTLLFGQHSPASFSVCVGVFVFGERGSPLQRQWLLRPSPDPCGERLHKPCARGV